MQFLDNVLNTPRDVPKPRSLEKGLAHNNGQVIVSLGDGAFKLLASEAKRRDATMQQLLRAVIIPEWVTQHLEDNPASMTRESESTFDLA